MNEIYDVFKPFGVGVRKTKLTSENFHETAADDLYFGSLLDETAEERPEIDVILNDENTDAILLKSLASDSSMTPSDLYIILNHKNAIIRGCEKYNPERYKMINPEILLAVVSNPNADQEILLYVNNIVENLYIANDMEEARFKSKAIEPDMYAAIKSKIMNRNDVIEYELASLIYNTSRSRSMINRPKMPAISNGSQTSAACIFGEDMSSSNEEDTLILSMIKNDGLTKDVLNSIAADDNLTRKEFFAILEHRLSDKDTLLKVALNPAADQEVLIKAFKAVDYIEDNSFRKRDSEKIKDTILERREIGKSLFKLLQYKKNMARFR